MHKKQFIFYLIIVIFIFHSCEERFSPNISTSEYESMLVVDGVITTEKGAFEVRLSNSVAIDQPNKIVPEKGAQVLIMNNDGKIYTLVEQENGWYRTLEKNLKAEIGKFYTLHIKTTKGVDYESSAVEVLSCPEIKSVNYREIVKTNFNSPVPTDEKWLEILVTTQGKPDDAKHLKWLYDETWEVNIPTSVTVQLANNSTEIADVIPASNKLHCWVNSPSSTILLGSTEKQSKNNISNYSLKKIAPNTPKLNYKYSILVKQYAIDQSLYKFWKKIENSNQSQGSLFDKTPSSAYGNITSCVDNKKTLGCFMACDMKTKRIFIDKSMHHIKTTNGYENCIYSYVSSKEAILFGKTNMGDTPVYCYDLKCADCTTNGTNIKPSFWK